MVPEGWIATQLGDCATFQSGGTPSKANPDFWNGEIPWVSAKDLKQHYIWDAQDHLTKLGAAQAKIAAPNSILMLVRGMTLMKDIPIGFVKRSVAFNQDVKALVTKRGIDPLFLSYLLVGKKLVIMGLVNTANHGTGRLDTELVQGLPLDLPPLPEQQKIAEILMTWDKAIETTEALLANARTQKRALMQSLLTGTRRFPGFEDQPWIEEKLEKLEEMGWVKLGRGNVISKKDIEANPGEHPIYSSSVVGDGMFGRYGSYMFDEEMITWSVDGGGHFFHRKRHRFSVTNVCGWMRADPTKLHYGFLAAQLQSLHARLEFNYQSKAHPSVIRSIYTLVVPSLEEQQLIGLVALEADAQIDLLIHQLDHLRTEKKSLMQQLLTGKRRVVV
jgi:type I restriction enzyme, S subunit